MKLRISRKIRAARRRAAHIPAPATLSTDLLAQVLYPSPTLTLECREAFQRLVETINRMAFYRNLQNEKNVHFAQLPSNQKDTCKNTIFEPLPEEQPS